MKPTLANIEHRLNNLEGAQGAINRRAKVLRLDMDLATGTLIYPARFPANRVVVLLPRKVSPEQWVTLAANQN